MRTSGQSSWDIYERVLDQNGTPQRVILTGTFITPKLVIEHPLTDYSLTLIEFPKTYYGAENKRTVVIRNASSIPAMFCTVAEHADGFVVSIATNDHYPLLYSIYGQ